MATIQLRSIEDTFEVEVPEVSVLAPTADDGPSRMRRFFLAQGTTAAQVSAALGLDPALLDRVANDRQPLPLDLADEIAVVVGSSRGDVVNAVSRTTTSTGTLSRRPVAARPVLGDALPPLVYTPTQEIVP